MEMMTLPKKLYRGPLVFEGNAFKRALFPGGYVQGGKAHFYVCDLQGSVRQVLDGETGNVKQETHYYPYGTPFGESTAERLSSLNGASVQPYLYGGKERIAVEGFNAYDYGARLQFSDLGIFGSPDPLADINPPVSQYAYCAGDPINLVDPTGMMPSEYESALMADVVYIKNLSPECLPDDLVNSGWSLSAFNTSIQMNYTLWNQNGLQSALFERTVDGVTEYAYVYAGSNSLEDWAENAFQLLGVAPQYDRAFQNAITLTKELEGKELTFVGHSLGGGEAAASSMATGRNAITFNAAAVSPFTKLFYNLGSSENVTNYRIVPPGSGSLRIGGCCISNLQENFFGLRAAGKQVKIPASDNNPISAHSISNFINYFNPKNQ